MSFCQWPEQAISHGMSGRVGAASYRGWTVTLGGVSVVSERQSRSLLDAEPQDLAARRLPGRAGTATVVAGAIDFHGHMCVALALGIRATELAMKHLGEQRHQGRMIVVAQTRSCSIDAVQYLSGCTLGKGNLVVQDHGKTVFTFLVPGLGGVRIAARAPITDANYRDVFTRLVEAVPRPDDRETFARMQRRLSTTVLNALDEDLFTVTPVAHDLPTVPTVPTVSPSIPCPSCGELTMQGRLVSTASSRRCVECMHAGR